MYKLPTISSLQRAMECPGSVVLPQLPDTEQSASALRGSRIHSWIQSQLLGTPTPDIGKTKVSHIDMDGLRAYLGAGDIHCEAAFSYDGERVEYLGDNIGREYNRPGTLCGAADIVVAGDLVIDIKTGTYPVPMAKENWQLAALAMMVGMNSLQLDGSSNTPVECVSGLIATLARDGSWQFDEHTWSLADLAIVRKRLDEARERWSAAADLESSGWGAPVVVGRECAFCKARCQHNPRVQREAI